MPGYPIRRRLDEIEGLLKTEVDPVGMALRLGDSEASKSIRAVGSVVIAVLKAASAKSNSKYIFPSIKKKKDHTGLTRWLQKCPTSKFQELRAKAYAIRSVTRRKISAFQFQPLRHLSATHGPAYRRLHS
jgi:hypothetical protein